MAGFLGDSAIFVVSRDYAKQYNCTGNSIEDFKVYRKISNHKSILN